MGYDYYDFSGMDEIGIGVAGGLLIVFLLLWLLMMAFSVVCYVLQSLGMYSIAKRRGIRKPWLSWIPVANMWTLGSISDQYQYVVKGKIRSRRKVLLGLTIGMFACFCLVEICALVLSFAGSEGSALGAVLMVLIAFAYLAVAVVSVVFQFIALYDLYASCDPGNAVLYLVLSILLNVTLPFFVFACRKKDLGMPPRKAPQPAAPVIPEPTAVPEATEEVCEEASETEAPESRENASEAAEEPAEEE